jgi:hypothetical protein
MGGAPDGQARMMGNSEVPTLPENGLSADVALGGSGRLVSNSETIWMPV